MSELPELVDLSVIFPSSHIDLKYVIAGNIIGAPIYREARCLLHTKVVIALVKSTSITQLAGLQLVAYDAYRPQQTQAILWNVCPDPQYVVDVAIGSNHSWGTAIDVTLMDDCDHLLNMGAGFDEMYDRSHAWYLSVPPAMQRNRLLLNVIMFGGGFVGTDSEWWHFELPGAARYPLLNDQIDCYTVMSTTTQHLP